MTEFEALYRTYYRDVFKYTLSLCRNRQLAEEITQDTFLKALENMDHFRGNCIVFVWLCQIAKNAYFTHCRKERRYAAESEISENTAGTSDPESTLLDADTAEALHRHLHDLSEPYREVFTLRVFAELSFAQIGALFQKSDSWARLVFFRAKKELWRRLHEHNL